MIHQQDDLYYLSFLSFDRTKAVNHGFSTRLGGYSKDIYTSLNLGLRSGDKLEDVYLNYKKICKALDIDSEDLVHSDQIHESHIYCVTQEDKGKGFYKDSNIKGIDGLITNEPKVPLITFYADCVPLYFLDPVQKVIGLAHAGWRGTVLKIAAKMIHKFTSVYKSDPKNILVGIGPSIGSCCFEVDESVAHAFQKQFEGDDWIQTLKNGKYKIDLWKVNQQILLESDIIEEHISIMGLCTMCHKDIFFSHRGHKGRRGSLGAIMELRD
ncbi:MAG: peptidoglycan editing factor PgeF [Epulopiscium sp.]|nr:peptidoglycan editing factor PgeF [Candidatus Epulonipiscium sp.]